MEVLGACSRKTTNAYYKNLKSYAKRYPEDSWWIVCLIDIKWRSTGAVTKRREMLLAHEETVETGGFSEFTPDSPWDQVYAAGASDSEFWKRWVTEQVILFTCKALPASVLVDGAVGNIGTVHTVDFDTTEGLGEHRAPRRGRSVSRKRSDRAPTPRRRGIKDTAKKGAKAKSAAKGT